VLSEPAHLRNRSSSPKLVLHDQRKSSEDTSEHNNKAVAASEVESSLCTTLGRGGWGSCRCRSSANSGINNTRCTTSSASWEGCRCLGCACGRYINSGGVLCTARMVISASTLACGIAVTCSNTLIAIFDAEEIWKSLRVFGCIRGYAVTTDAIVSELVRVAVISFCGRRCTRKLQAEQRAGGHLGLAPTLSSWQWDSARIDVVCSLGCHTH
jgi:hypothetical protein